MRQKKKKRDTEEASDKISFGGTEGQQRDWGRSLGKTVINLDKNNLDRLGNLAKHRNSTVSKEINRFMNAIDMDPDKTIVILAIPKEVIEKGEVRKWVSDRSVAIDQATKILPPDNVY